MAKRYYEGTDLTVSFDAEVCIHSGNCVRGLHEVFNLEQRPWIQVDQATKEEVMRVIDTCPSGALQYEVK
ncbi:hypothetical protein GCM10007425_11410 [Lysinibacillus alkalisoli]|uniref:Divergent 4Fe-4S mono-cluster domain-containing protein n=1 Tax=Lysinibacillus alkalisoli TaxID=1911548 RepID=A0A917LF87_9BACI|nr:(4Fe-4S)-binding protein [Lysinibacillus alkalisoli]GGG18629.1 hypothetical protein GCM10007425_11410 [Lysinibacillus alkalisoli]